MECQKCKYPHANPLGCTSCGWKFDPDYHPDLGSGPEDSAEWILAQSRESLDRMYGSQTAALKISIAKSYLGAHPKYEPAPTAPVIPPAKASVVTGEPPVAAEKPDFTAAAVEEVEAEPIGDRMMAAEEEAPTAAKPKRSRAK